MPNINILKEVKNLKVDDTIKKNINALEGFITKHESSALSNLLIPHHEEYINFSQVIKPFMSLDKVFFDTIANGISRNNLVTKITKLKEDIRNNFDFLNKEYNCFADLDNAKKNLEEEVQKKSDDQNESKIGEAENILKKYTILVLEQQIKKNNKNFEAAVKFYDVNSNKPLCLARYMWLKDQSKQSIPDLEHAELSVHLIKETINNQAKADNTGSILPVEGDITLFDLGRINDWNNFKFNFGKRLNELRSKKNETEALGALGNETSNALLEKNSQLLNEVSELKKKIISLKIQLFDANSNIEENKLTENNDKEPTNSNIVTSDSLQNQNDEEITDLNNQLSQLTETNKTLTEEVDTNKELNVKQKQTILNLNSELKNLKVELEIKEKQITENLEKLKQHEEQLISQEKALLKNTQALEKSTQENEKLSGALTASSKTLAEKNQSLIKTESELNELKGAHNRIKLEIEGLNHKLEQNTRYSNGILEQKQEEITQLNTELKQLNEQLITAKADFSSNSTAHDHKTLLLETKIEEKNSSLAGLKNKLTDSEEKTNQLKKDAAELKRQLDAKSLTLQDNESQLKTLTEQFETLRAQKNTLEKDYATQLAEHDSLYAQHALNIQNLEGELAKLQEKNTLTENENLGLQENVVTLERNLQEKKIAEQKVAQLKTDLFALQKTLTSTGQDLKFQLNQTMEEKKAISEKLQIVTKERDSFIFKANDVLPNFISSDSKDYFTLVPADSNKEFEGILQKIDLLKRQEEENEKKIEELQDQLEILKLESDEKDAKIFRLKLPNLDLDDENTKTLTLEKDHLQKKVALLTNKLSMLEQQNKNFAQDPIPPARFSLDFDFEDDDFQSAPVTDSYDSDNEDEADHYQSFAATQEELVSTKALLNITQTELQQKIDELSQLQSQLESQEKLRAEIEVLNKFSERFVGTIATLKYEKENLNQKLKDAQEALQTSKSEINDLQVEIEKQQTNKSSDKEQISKLTKQLDELNKFKSQQEKLISELQSQLISKNAELKKLSNQYSVNDELITDLKNTISTYENKLIEPEKEIKTLKGKLETKQKDDSNLKVDYAKLDIELSEKILELNKIQTELKSTKEQLEEARAKNITQGGLTMPGTQTDLIDFGNSIGEDHPDQIHPTTNLINKDGSSSGHSSRHSSSNSQASSENINSHFYPLFSYNQNPNSEDEAFAESHSLETNSSNSSLTRSHSLPDLTAPSVNTTTLPKNYSTSELTHLGTGHLGERPIINTGTPMPRSEQQDAQVDNTSSIHARGVINAFNEEHHEEIGQAFRAEFSRIATAAANLLFNENIVANAVLPTFKNALDEKANKEVQDLILALSNNKKLLSGIIGKIRTNGLNASTYLEEVKNSASFIFGTLQVAQKNYKDHIADIGQDLLIKLCIENLQKEGKANLLQLAKRVLKNRVTINNLQPAEHTETIKIAAEELVTTILETKNIKNIIEAVRNLSITDPNLLEASKQKLQEQLEQEVDQSFDHYFPIVHLNPIFQKIKGGDVLSEEEIQKIPSELQYADTIKDFVSGLRVKYSHLSSDYEGKIEDNNFKNLRLILRKKALVDTNQVIPKDNEIIDLDAKAWLEKKLQLITGKSVNLELVKLEKEQENLLNELSSSLQISTFYDIAITRKTIPELTQEIEKANKAQLSAAEQISQIFKEIENKQTSHPKLIDDEAIAGFEANLNQHLENSSLALAVNNEQAKILLMGINQRLKKDISKWGFLDNKLQKEITNDIANTNGFPFDETATEKLVQHAMLVLRDNYPNDTLEKRKQWLKDIALLHAITKKLATFSPKIKENIAKFEDLRVRKEEDINQLEEPAANKIADAVYLPHRHTIIANSLDPNLAKRLPADFELLDGAFYKQDPLQIGQTLTFALSLHNGEEQKCSVTRDETCLAYKIHTPWLNIVNKIKGGVANKMTYARSNTNSSEQFNTEEETLFTLLTHAVNSSKGPTHTIMLGKNCSNEKERFIRLFVEKFNAEQKLSSKKTILLANANDKLKIHSDDKKTIYNKIHKANSLTEELDNATTRTIDTLNRHITRPRG